MVYVLARIIVKPEAADGASDILKKLVAQSRQEAGCLSYELYQQADAPHVFQTVEQWADSAAFDAHRAAPHVAAAIAAAGPVFAEAPEIVVCQKLA